MRFSAQRSLLRALREKLTRVASTAQLCCLNLDRKQCRQRRGSFAASLIGKDHALAIHLVPSRP